MVHILGKDYVIHFRVFAHRPVTKKPLAVRMGGGVGAPESWECIVKAGTILVEVDGSNKELIVKTLNQASQKLPCSTKVVSKQGGEIC
jgi:large subunit ribosomal protein L16